MPDLLILSPTPYPLGHVHISYIELIVSLVSTNCNFCFTTSFMWVCSLCLNRNKNKKKNLSHLKIHIHKANVTALMLHPSTQLFIGRLRWRTNKWGRISQTFIDIASYAYVTSICQVPMTFASESIIQSGCLYLS